jgi:beta-glucanase (GH16 family)
MINAFGYKWRTKQPWGRYHPKNGKAWYSDNAVIVNSNDSLELRTFYSPKTFSHACRTMACGLITSTYDNFGYGEYEIVVKMPRGRDLWSSFWFSPIGEAPPEVDVFEAETKKNGGLFKFNWRNPLAFWNIKTNAHYGKNYGSSHKDIGSDKAFFSFSNPQREYMKYKFIWQKESIKIYYNDLFVRSITNRGLLKQLEGKKIMIIINNIVSDNFSSYEQESIMRIKSFSYKPYK